MTLERQLSRALPSHAAIRVADSVPPDFELLPAEAEATETMRDRRRHEFVLGRYCARQAMIGLGVSAQAVGKDARRAPIWPPGIIGSIAHSKGVAAAAVAQQSRLAGLGLDIEQRRELSDDIIALVCCDAEQKRLDACGEKHERALLYFSAKESVYKCIWPSIQRYVDFRDVAIEIDADNGRFVARAFNDYLDDSLLPRVAGLFGYADNMIWTTATLAGE